MKTGRIRLGLPYNHIPQGFLKPNGDWVGFEVDLGAAMAKRMNLKLEPTKVNDKTWSALLANGQIDAALCRIRQTRTLEREFDFSVPYFFDSLQILAPKGEFKKAADLKGHKIAAIQGSSAESLALQILRAAGDENAEQNVVSFPDRPAAFMALGRAKVSGWIDSESVERVAVPIVKHDSAWRDLINFTIQDVYEDGSFKKIYDKWFGPNTPYFFPARRPIDIWPQ
jgi:polar amino acid transport system substrate-binding protein